MNLVNTNDKNPFDPTPKLKSSPIPIKFVAFNEFDDKCVYCGEKYIETLLCKQQKYCQKCLSHYINDITDNNLYLDVYIYTMDIKCNEHKISRSKVTQNIQECCGNCASILLFKQMNGCISRYNLDINIYNQVIESEKYCRLCEKSLLYKYKEYDNLQLCSDCYLISSGWVESTLTRQQVSILYLPWLHNDPYCKKCNEALTSSDQQEYCVKYCTKCNIFYIGCRYCLTTNIIFGLTGQSQCKKCKRISFTIMNVENSDFNDFFNIIRDKSDNSKIDEFTNTIENVDKYFSPSNILNSIYLKENLITPIIWIPYSKFINIKEITKGGFGVIYQATWLSNNETVILKRFNNSKYIDKHFLSEVIL
jgi:hypothetical protein